MGINVQEMRLRLCDKVPELLVVAGFMYVVLRMAATELRHHRDALDGVLGQVAQGVERIDVRTRRCLGGGAGHRARKRDSV